MTPRLALALPLVLAAATADAAERKCADLPRVIAEAHKDKNLLRTRTIERMPMLRLQAVRPNKPPIMPDYDAGLLVEWKDGSGILLKGFGLTLCREQFLTQMQLTEHRILLASFTKSKTKRERTRKPYQRSARAPVETKPVIAGRAME